jgi:hypothetical protein
LPTSLQRERLGYGCSLGRIPSGQVGKSERRQRA